MADEKILPTTVVGSLSEDELRLAVTRWEQLKSEQRRAREQERIRHNQVRATELLTTFVAELGRVLTLAVPPGTPNPMAAVSDPRKLYLELRDLINSHNDELETQNIPEGFLYGGQS